MSKNNIQRLKDEADIASVIAYLGIPTHRKGACTFILCPRPDHDDAHPTNSYYKDGWNNVLCRVCNTSINAIDLIMYTTGASYGEAADLLWEISGRPDWYYAKRTKKKEFTLTEEEKTLIGLHLPTRILVPKSLKDYKETLRKDRRYDPAFVDGYLQLETQYVHTADFADRGAFRRIVFNRTTDTLSELRYKRKHEPDNAIREIYTQAESTCEDILARLREAQRKTKRGRA